MEFSIYIEQSSDFAVGQSAGAVDSLSDVSCNNSTACVTSCVQKLGSLFIRQSTLAARMYPYAIDNSMMAICKSSLHEEVLGLSYGKVASRESATSSAEVKILILLLTVLL